MVKKALIFSGLDSLLKGLKAELLPSQLALLIIRSYLSLIENYILEGIGSVVTLRALSNRIEQESKVSDNKSTKD